MVSFFICSICSTRTIKTPNQHEGICQKCRLHQQLDEIYGGLSNYPQISLLNVCISEYTSPIVDDYYVLIKIDDSIRELLIDVCLGIGLPETTSIVPHSKYVLATKQCLSNERVECYFHNRFSRSVCGRTRVIILEIDTFSGDWTVRFMPIGPVMNIELDGISAITHKATDLLNEAVDVRFLIYKLKGKYNKIYLYRGINKLFDKNDGIASALYRNNKDLVEFGMLQEHEQEVVSILLSKPYYQIPSEGLINSPKCQDSSQIVRENIRALTDLRHSGKDTCLIDFTIDPMIALFFACHRTSDTASIGEILIFPKSHFEERTEVDYPAKKDFVISPPETDITKNRVLAQKSVFIYCHQGYLPRDNYEKICETLLISSEIKESLLSKCGYLVDDIYHDFYGFIDNPENFDTTYKFFCSAKAKMKEKNYGNALHMLRVCEIKSDKNWIYRQELLDMKDKCIREIEKRKKVGK